MPLLLILLGGAVAGALVARGGAGKRATRKLARAERAQREPRKIKLQAQAKLLQDRYVRRHDSSNGYVRLSRSF